MSIKCVIFDFDGTIKQSVAIKHEAYYSAVEGIERGAEIFSEIIREFPEMTRYSSCDLFAERARVLGIATPDGATLAERYTKACEDAIAECPAVPGAYKFIDWLRARDVDCFVVSGTPQQAMRDTIVRIGLMGHFVNVFGSPTKKPDHYRNILRDRRLTGEALLVIGDGDDDKAASQKMGAHFVRVRGRTGLSQVGERNVSALTEILNFTDLAFHGT